VLLLESPRMIYTMLRYMKHRADQQNKPRPKKGR
jgi:hypothetical protein